MARWEPDAAGRLVRAAIELFETRGYDETTVADIAAAAGLTKRTFFRHFADKREVLFSGSEHMQAIWVDAVRSAPASATSLEAICAGLGPIAARFTELHKFATVRARIVVANPDLYERELKKLALLAETLAGVLRDRGVEVAEARMAASTGVLVFEDALDTWLAQPDKNAFEQIMRWSLNRLEVLVTSSRPKLDP